MSLSRLALRLATLEALFPSALTDANDVFPTLAKNRVYLSALDPIETGDAAVPCIVIYTDDEDGEPGQRAGGPPFDCAVDLVIEFAHVAMMRGEDAEFVAAHPYLDDELEASLDLLEAQIVFALLYGPTGKLWRNLTGRKVRSLKSSVQRGSEETPRLAVRTLHLRVAVPDDVYAAAPLGTETGLDLLPQPLRDVAAALVPDSPGGRIVAALVGDIPAMPARGADVQVKLDFQPGSPPGPSDPNKRHVIASAPDNLPQG